MGSSPQPFAVYGTVVLVVISLCAARLFPGFVHNQSIKHFPLIGKKYGSYHKRMMAFVHHAESIYIEGFTKFKGAVYRLTTADGMAEPQYFVFHM